MQNNVEEIKSRLNIVDVVGEYVRLTKAGAHWKGLCPFHHEKSPSFMVNEEKQIFHCFGCTKGGDVFSFIQEIESMDFREALKLLAEKAGVKLEEFSSKEQSGKKTVLEILEIATKFFENELKSNEKIKAYLKGRGLTDQSIERFRIGYSPNSWDSILNLLISKGHKIEDIAKTGLLVEKNNPDLKAKSYNPKANYYDRFRDRIMFPVQDILGNVIGFSARVAPGGDESQAKYINTPETSVYHKSRALYGIWQAKTSIKKKNYVLLVEGNMDVIASHQAGLDNAVAVSGTALTSEQIDMLKRYTNNIAMLFDMDSAGQNAAKKSADLCFQKEMNVKIVTLKDGKDAAEVVQNDPKKLIEAMKASVPAMEYFLQGALLENDKNTPDGKKKIAEEVLSHVSFLVNKIEHSYWVKKISHEIDVEENVLSSVLSSVSGDRKRFGREQDDPATQQKKSFEKEGFGKRSDVIRENMIGLIMSNSAVWKEIGEQMMQEDWVKNDPVIRLVIEKGQQGGYSLDKMVSFLDDERLSEYLRGLYFKSKYRFEKESIAEPSMAELRGLVGEQILNYRKELQKEKLHAIIREIKNAEDKGDKDTLNTLMAEFVRLSQQINE